MDDGTVTTTVDPAAFAPLFIVTGVIAVFMIVCVWRVFSKAGQPGWAAIIPIYNIYVQCKVARKPGWWTLLFFIPLVNLVFAIIVSIGIAKAFGKGGAFGFFGLVLFPFVGYPILAFGDARYVGAGDTTAPQQAPAHV
ncbi:DUF5684 domain-containing protein [Actinophytocola sp.]|uniref:DUF5684 domain-containing protein n=1 Tax=Actinophytocola sp. TaxID=1872138 RepID=UPI002D7E67F5|nr:DUF5684 domain-containing protein [Actinophytocola sp.]HET9140966.1 DUF5684 domain-containing protein [Actinophytocola sp.]HEU5108874.1 DUF5684 domain-containing protein [Micromonosporaceae bacterium]